MSCAAILAAAGRARRLGLDLNKALLPLGGEPVLVHALRPLAEAPSIEAIVVVARSGEEERCRLLAERYGGGKVLDVVTGGDERQESVARGLAAVPEAFELVAVHDAARPFVTAHLVEETVAAARRWGAACLALPARDTVKLADDEGFVAATPPRERIWLAQTPQVFRRSLLVRAFRAAAEAGRRSTDEASLVEALGGRVRLVAGSPLNIKITEPADLRLAEGLVAGVSGGVRVGFGYDVHPLADGRPLVLGGVRIPWGRGLLGNTDADVACHALMDALLGAAGLGDIGGFFPPDAEEFRDAESLALLRRVAAELRGRGWRVSNADVTILAEEPRLAPLLTEMARLLGEAVAAPGRVNVKAARGEGLGFVGRGEGMAAHAVVLIRAGVD